MTAIAGSEVVQQIGQTPVVELRSFSTENI